MARAPDKPSSWPWHPFVALGLAAAVCLAAYGFFKPALSFSSPVLSLQDGGYRADFQAANSSRQTQSAVVEVVFGYRMSSDGGESYGELARTRMTVQLAARERKQFSCVFPDRLPFLSYPTARVEIAAGSSAHPGLSVHAPQMAEPARRTILLCGGGR